MRRLSRLDGSIDVLRSRAVASLSSTYLCSCRQHSPFSTALRRRARSDSKPWTDTLRRKIWKDQPPGLEDPYDSSSASIKKHDPKEEETLIEEEQDSNATTPQVDMSTYVPATTWDGLIEVGEEPEETFSFEGFMPDGRVTDPFEATAALHRAVVEVFTMKNAGKVLSEISNGNRTVDVTSTVQVSLPGPHSSPVFDYSSSGSEDAILQSFRGGDLDNEVIENMGGLKDVETFEPVAEQSGLRGERSTESLEVLQSGQFQRQVASWSPIWLKISLDDPEIKFAVVKRVMQLTGIRIPDSGLRLISTVQSLLGHLTTPPKPKKLAEALITKDDLVSLPNVKLFDRRVTPIDKDISVGRWKIIEKELEKRGLPVTGH